MVFSNIRDVYQANCELWAYHMLPAVEQCRKTKQPISASMLKEGFLKVKKIAQEIWPHLMKNSIQIHFQGDVLTPDYGILEAM